MEGAQAKKAGADVCVEIPVRRKRCLAVVYWGKLLEVTKAL